MKDKNTHDSEIIEELKQRFGAIPENEILDEEEERFLQERAKVEELYSWDFEAFVQHFQLIKGYGLEEKLLETLEWKIQHFLEPSELKELRQTEFYRLFGEHKIIKDAFLQREIK